MDDASAADLYEQALRPRRPLWSRALWAAWTAAGLAALMALAWAEPFSARLLSAAVGAGLPRFWAGWLLLPLVMAARGVLLVEAFGYLYHRWFQHVGWMTRRSQLFRRNQMYHWIHHMVIYPIGSAYRKAVPYVSSEDGAWSWVVPGILVAVLALATKGAGPGTLAFIAGIGLYAEFIVNRTHARFHETVHPWMDKPYFRRLEDIHLLHHWDQRTNFTIVHPLMDVLFGTYLSPAFHRREIETALKDRELTVSDLINWRYLLLEATPAEYAAFITQARRHPRSVRKLCRLLETLEARLERLPGDAEAAELLRHAEDLLRLVRPPEPAAAAG